MLIIAHLADVMGIESLQKARDLGEMEFFVVGLDAQIEAVGGGVAAESLVVEKRMIRLRQPVQREHAEYRGQRGAENR